MQLVVTAVIIAVCILYHWWNKIYTVLIIGKTMYNKNAFLPFIVIDLTAL